MPIDLTMRSAVAFDAIAAENMTPSLAAEYLKNGQFVLRNFSEILREVYPYPDLQQRLTNAFCTYEPEAKPASVVRKISNWLAGKNQPTKRDELIRIAFALDLTEAQLNLLLGHCTGYCLHYREPRDVVFAWFLQNDRSYQEALAFYTSLPQPERFNSYPPKTTSHLTRALQQAFSGVGSTEQLCQIYMDNLDKFGQLHVRAYQYFDKYLSQLMRPNAQWRDGVEDCYSLEKIMEVYMSMHMPSSRSRGQYTLVQKLIKQNWPNATALKNIHGHREDVPRKLLLLLYIITENAIGEDYNELDESYFTPQDRLEEHWWILNGILVDCGMPTLDPRNPFDWLILYAIAADEDESMSDRMTEMIDKIFADVN